MCGVVEDGVVPGLFGFEAGQSGVGDIFAWFTESCVPPEYHEVGRRARRPTCTRSSRRRRRSCAPARAGCSRSTGGTATAPCSSMPISAGLLVGMTLATRAPEIYRALIEATAFGTRVIIDAFESAGVPVDRDRRVRRAARAEQAADADLRRRHRPRVRRRGVAGRRRRSARRCSAPSRPARRSAATTRSSTPRGRWRISERDVYRPIAGHHAVYEGLYREYVRLHDLFGRGGDDVMRNLKTIQLRVGEAERLT